MPFAPPAEPLPIVSLTAEPMGRFTELRLVVDGADPGELEGRDIQVSLSGALELTVRARLSRRTNLEAEGDAVTVALILARELDSLEPTAWRAVVESPRRRRAPIAAGGGEVAREAASLVA